MLADPHLHRSLWRLVCQARADKRGEPCKNRTRERACPKQSTCCEAGLLASPLCRLKCRTSLPFKLKGIFIKLHNVSRERLLCRCQPVWPLLRDSSLRAKESSK